MNDEAAATPAEPHPSADPATPIAEASNVAHAQQDAEEQRKKIAEKKAANLKETIREFDVLIYAQLAAVYYMDTSLLRFFLRAFMQLMYFTPKPPLIPSPPMKDRPYLGAIFGANILCLILHLYMSRPTTGEATRGYLHGGLLIDFVGQKGPSPRWMLALLDIGITVLQAVMLTVVVEERELESHRKRKHRLRQGLGNSEEAGAPREVSDEEEELPRQDHDAEERGARRSTEGEPLLPSSRITDVDDPAAAAELLDRLRSGQAMTAKLFVVDTIRDEWRSYSEARAAATGTASGSEAISAAWTRTGAAARFGFRAPSNGG